MAYISEGAAGGDKDSQLSAMLSSPSAGGMRLAGNYAQRGSPGEGCLLRLARVCLFVYPSLFVAPGAGKRSLSCFML